MLVRPLKLPDLLPIEDPGLCTVQEGGNDDGSVYQVYRALKNVKRQSNVDDESDVYMTVNLMFTCVFTLYRIGFLLLD